MFGKIDFCHFSMAPTSVDPPTTPIFGANIRANDHFWIFFGDFWLHTPILPFLRKFPLILTIVSPEVPQKKYFWWNFAVFDEKWTKIAKNSQKCQKIAIWRPKSAQIGLKKIFDPKAQEV